ncbi:MAG: hypothetical protein JW739_03375 [Opitutales bacterium]|nr:hypothetical protein [Opitutales bacterium]
MNTDLNFKSVLDESISMAKQHWKFILVALLISFVVQIPTAIPILGIIASLALTGPITIGVLNAILRTTRGETVVYKDVFCGFNRWLKSCAVFILVGLMTGFGTLLLIIPGIIIGLGLLPANFLVMEEDLGILDTISKAWDMTKGKKMDLFICGLIFLACVAVVVAVCMILIFIPIIGILIYIAAMIAVMFIGMCFQIVLYERIRNAYYGVVAAPAEAAAPESTTEAAPESTEPTPEA